MAADRALPPLRARLPRTSSQQQVQGLESLRSVSWFMNFKSD